MNLRIMKKKVDQFARSFVQKPYIVIPSNYDNALRYGKITCRNRKRAIKYYEKTMRRYTEYYMVPRNWKKEYRRLVRYTAIENWRRRRGLTSPFDGLMIHRAFARGQMIEMGFNENG